MTDREKVISTLEEIKTQAAGIGLDSAVISHKFIDKIITLMKEQEAVEQKTGHWIWLQYCANEGVYCSECHTKMFDRYPMKKKLSQFCGHCGAKMVDEVESR